MKTDKQLKADIENELGWEPSLKAEKIGVSVNDGIVQLSGQVGSFAEKYAAQRAALRVADVKAVAVEIDVVLAGLDTHTDEDLARAALDHLRWNSAVPDTVKVEVAKGWITLSGEVEWQYQRLEAETAVRFMSGVKGVINEIMIHPKPTSEDVKNRIEEAIKRSAALDAAKIRVTTEGGTVTLRGTVGSWMEREDAERAAWSAPGVVRVQDDILVG
ncbi:MAG TPA: BON domain-containing protein [Opitutaceae bacterium]|nr:BON domain-containing protein [Opitutaceae bacterium]